MSRYDLTDFEGRVIERSFSNLKHFRRVAIYYDKLSATSPAWSDAPRCGCGSASAAPRYSARNFSMRAAVSLGRVTMKRCPSSIISNRALGMIEAKIFPLMDGTIGSSEPDRINVGRSRRQSQGKLDQPAIARS